MNNDAFRADWKALPTNIQAEAKAVIKSLSLEEIDKLPAKLHFHQLTSKQVPSRLDEKKKVAAWSLHITADDRYKASFTFEGGTIFFRTCGLHDTVDKRP